MNEVDGVVAGDFFTVLCVGQSYTEDQWMNMYAFSMLRKWLRTYDTEETSGSGMWAAERWVALSQPDRS